MKSDDEKTELTEELKAAFNLFDRDGQGMVYTKDLKAILYSLGVKVSKKQVGSLLQRKGKDGYAMLDFSEFSMVVKDAVRRRVVDDGDEELFHILDVEGVGYITLASLKQATTELGETFNAEDLREILQEGATDPQVGISKEKFLRIMRAARRQFAGNVVSS
ncbi:hypothetical protein CTAYLR_000770 [Chrysophaeum taylorii]|uniref:EF-hand domain-containing protein n=1 Tax=Chrysophaeum taylorii TaxID=2483200 RepID=A0AAD7UPZ6_9STRA|nr:hypothetical protein CTAYLR_000770 [Chrysophaeum taylorii]